MGYYINKDSKGLPLPAKGKAKALISDGAKMTDATYKENLICVVENLLFDAAGYMFSEQEFRYFKETSPPKIWLVHEKAKELAE